MRGDDQQTWPLWWWATLFSLNVLIYVIGRWLGQIFL